MKAFTLSVYCCFGVLWTLAAGASIPRYFEKHPNTRRDLSSTQIQRELGAKVSNTTLIFGPDDGRFNDATSRWNMYLPPKFQLVVEPGRESDIPAIVKYCVDNSLDFLATNGGHGLTSSLGEFSGVQISMRQLNKIDIQPSGKTAWFGGGTLVGQVTQYLWDRGYVTTTGGCECVGMVGAGLGGGHGRHEGLYGLIIDNMLQFNLVLANGSTIVVNETSHSDLLWGMKGAGHNFGIVTSYEMNIFPRGPDLWHYHNYVWRGDKLETVFEELNKFHGNGTTPINMAFENGAFLVDPSISTEEPVLSWTFAYRGPAEEAEELLVPFNAIGAVFEQVDDVPYTEIAHAQSTGMNDPICQHGNARISSTAGLQLYNLTAERLIFEGFRRRAIEDPVLVSGASLLHEGYSTQGVEAIDSASTAYPFREDRHLVFFNAVVPHNDKAREEAATAWATEIRDQFNAGQPHRTIDAYVNYAGGSETLSQRYGHECWRIKRLLDLKARYDPYNRFRFYNPIVVD